MEQILLITGSFSLLILFYLLVKELKSGDIINKSMNKELNEFSDRLRAHQREEFEILRSAVEGRLDKISDRVQENLNEGFDKTAKTFASVLERLARIDEAQKKIEGLSENVVSLQDVLTDKKSRGIFGEVQLNQVLSNVFGSKSDPIYELQKTLSNGKIVDALLKLPGPLGSVPIDSKFPLENFKKMTDRTLEESVRKQALKDFKINLKKHIDDIASKYITPKETANQAILFLPAEAIFAEVHAYHQDIVDYASDKRVWISSPTTFLAILTTIQTVLINMERSKYMTVMHEEINKLGQEFDRYQSRWSDLAKHIQTVSKDVEKINITSDKITGQFQKIMEVELEGVKDC